MERKEKRKSFLIDDGDTPEGSGGQTLSAILIYC